MAAVEPTISLEQFAGIRAALAENLSLAGILEQEQIDEAALRESEPAWRERIADSVATQLEYTEKLRIAEDTLARKLSPIGDDEAAWVGLLGTMATSSDQSALLAKLGITLTDIGRLGRVWKQRMQADPELGPRLAKLAETPTPPETVTAGPVELRPFPWSPKTKRATVPAALAPSVDASADAALELRGEPKVQRVLASFQREEAPPAVPPARTEEPSFDAWTLEHYAALARGLRANPEEADAVMQQSGLLTPESRRLVHQHFQRRFQAEPGLRARFDALLAPPASVAPPGAEAPSRRKDPLGGTEEMDSSQVRKAALPFQKDADAKPPPIAPPRERSPQDMGSTVVHSHLEASKGSANESLASQDPRRRPRKTVEGLLSKHTPEDAARIARIKDQFTRKPDPFAGTANMDVVKPVRPEETLPFKAASQGALPVSPSAPQRQSGKTIASEAPLGWTLDRYASLLARLLTSGQPESQVLAEVGVSGAAKGLLDSYWQPLIRDDPKVRSDLQALTHKHIEALRRR